MKKTIGISAILFSTLVQAYVLPPSYFFQQWITENKLSSSFLIKQERDYYISGAVTRTVAETVKIKRPGLYKWISETPGQEEVKILGRNRATTGTLQQQTPTTLQNVITPFEAMAIYSQASAIDSFMKQMGVDVTKTKLELVQKNKLLRVGDERGSRIYISPDTGTMDAMVYQGRLYFFKYDQVKYGFYPSDIEIYENDVLKEKVHVKTMVANAKISETEFESK